MVPWVASRPPTPRAGSPLESSREYTACAKYEALGRFFFSTATMLSRVDTALLCKSRVKKQLIFDFPESTAV
eukprot:1192946-Prorocentrum_minimum.AAC.8